jgi:hypothetical protein
VAPKTLATATIPPHRLVNLEAQLICKPLPAGFSQSLPTICHSERSEEPVEGQALRLAQGDAKVCLLLTAGLILEGPTPYCV